MTFNQYQKKARKTAVYSKHLKVIYPALGLAGESGETCEKVKKVLRDNNEKFDLNSKIKIIKEMGDVLWYLANLAEDLDVSLDFIAERNLRKLGSRKKRKKLKGEGDNR